MDFFVHFFDLLGVDIHAAMEDSRSSGSVCGGLNTNFIALITKSKKPLSFADYRPISLFNMLYKVITKIIANRLKPVLSLLLSKNQFGFLENRQIMDAIDIAQEAFHYLKIKRKKGLVLKLDLHKAYDCIRWDFLRLLLIQIGLSLSMVDWIMGCVSSTTFAALINGGPTGQLCQDLKRP